MFVAAAELQSCISQNANAGGVGFRLMSLCNAVTCSVRVLGLMAPFGTGPWRTNTEHSISMSKCVRSPVFEAGKEKERNTEELRDYGACDPSSFQDYIAAIPSPCIGLLGEVGIAIERSHFSAQTEAHKLAHTCRCRGAMGTQ